MPPTPDNQPAGSSSSNSESKPDANLPKLGEKTISHEVEYQINVVDERFQGLNQIFVARGKVILVEFTDFKGSFTSISAQYLQKLPSTNNNKLTCNCDGHTFSYLVENGFTYCVVSIDSAGLQIPMSFLERVKEDFDKRYGGEKSATAQANSLNKEFRYKLKEHMQYCMDHPDEISKLAKAKKAQASEARDAMMKTIDKVLARSEKHDYVYSEPQVFIRPRRRKMLFKNMNIKLIVLAIIIALILIIITHSVCGGFNCGK